MTAVGGGTTGSSPANYQDIGNVSRCGEVEIFRIKNTVRFQGFYKLYRHPIPLVRTKAQCGHSFRPVIRMKIRYKLGSFNIIKTRYLLGSSKCPGFFNHV